MIATHRVKDNSNNTIGFVLQDNSEFHNLYTIKKYIDRITNLSIRKDGVVIAEKALPIKKYSEIIKGCWFKISGRRDKNSETISENVAQS